MEHERAEVQRDLIGLTTLVIEATGDPAGDTSAVEAHVNEMARTYDPATLAFGAAVLIDLVHNGLALDHGLDADAVTGEEILERLREYAASIWPR